MFIWKINIGYHFIIHNKTCSNEKAIKNWIFDKDKICEIIYFFCFWKEWNMDSWNNHINILFVFISHCVCVEKLLRNITGRLFLFHKIYVLWGDFLSHQLVNLFLIKLSYYVRQECLLKHNHDLCYSQNIYWREYI